MREIYLGKQRLHRQETVRASEQKSLDRIANDTLYSLSSGLGAAKRSRTLVRVTSVDTAIPSLNSITFSFRFAS